MQKFNGLSIDNIFFSFTKSDSPLFRGLSANFIAGKIHFIRGKNGSGKSTLFRILQGKISSNEQISGTICFDSKKFDFSSEDSFSKIIDGSIKVVQQKFDFMLADKFSFDENLSLAKMNRFPTLFPLEGLNDVPDLINHFSIDRNKPVFLLSGGQRQILAILMVLQKHPKILLLDEPTAALDDKNSRMVMQFLLELVERIGLTVIIICHDKELVEEYSREGYLELCDGKFVKRS